MAPLHGWRTHLAAAVLMAGASSVANAQTTLTRDEQVLSRWPSMCQGAYAARGSRAQRGRPS